MATQPSLPRSVINALLLQTVVVLACSLILDHHEMAGYYVIGVFVSWLGVIWMMLRCRGKLTWLQAQAIQFGWVLLGVYACLLLLLGRVLAVFLGIVRDY